jgi:hypothetical protein
MDEATFKNRVANAFPQALKSAGLPAEVAQATGRYTLQNLTGTKYLVRQGTEDLTGPKGRVVLEVPDLPSTYPVARRARAPLRPAVSAFDLFPAEAATKLESGRAGRPERGRRVLRGLATAPVTGARRAS